MLTISLPGDRTTDHAKLTRVSQFGSSEWTAHFETNDHGPIKGYVKGTRELLLQLLAQKGFTNTSTPVEVEIEVSRRGNWYVQLQAPAPKAELSDLKV